MVKKKIGNDEFTSNAFLVVEDAEKSSTWHLRVKDSDGTVNHRLLGAAWAALHEGYRGNKYEGPEKENALKKLKALYKSEGLDTPSETKTEQSLSDKIDAIRSVFWETFNNIQEQIQSSYILEVFDDHIICQQGDVFYSVNFKENNDGQIEFDGKDKWTKVEKTYSPVKNEDDTMVAWGSEVKINQDGHMTGYLVTFGSPLKTDSSVTKDFFNKQTDFGFHVGMKTPVWFHHCLPIKAKNKNKTIRIIDEIGEGTLSIDDTGVLIDAIITNTKYATAIKANVSLLGWSSGTAAHLVQRIPQSNGTHWVKRWLLGVDASLTPDPADKNNRASLVASVKTITVPDCEIDFEMENNNVDDTKSITRDFINIENNAVKKDKSDGTINNIMMEGELTMTQVEFDAAVKIQVDAALKAKADNELAIKAAEEVKKQEDEKLQKKIDEMIQTSMKTRGRPVNSGGNKVDAANLNLKTQQGDDAFKAFGHYLKTGDAGGIRTGEAYEELKATYSLLESTQYQGQEAVPTEVVNRIVERRDPISIVRAAGAEIMPVGSNAVVIPIEKNSPEKFVITTIDGTATFDQTTQQPMDKASVTIYMFTKSVPIDIQLLDDAVFDVEAWWSRRISRAMALTENYYFIIGTGSGQPTGIVTGATLGVTAASATAITAPEVVKLYHTLTSEYRDNVSIFMTGAVEGILRGLSGSPFYFTGNGGNSGGVGNTGQPQGAGWFIAPNTKVFNAADMDAITASKKPLVVGNCAAGYTITERKGLTVLRDPYSLAAKGQINILSFFRNSGAVTNAAAFQYLATASA